MPGALQNPQILVEEYRSLLEASNSGTELEHERKRVDLALKQVQLQEDRITQADVNEAMDLQSYKMEMDRLRARSKELEGISRDLDRKADQEQDAERSLQHLQTFCRRVAEGLDNMSFEERQELLRLVVDRITVENETVRIETVIPGPNDSGQLRTRRGELVEPPTRRPSTGSGRRLRKLPSSVGITVSTRTIPFSTVARSTKSRSSCWRSSKFMASRPWTT